MAIFPSKMTSYWEPIGELMFAWHDSKKKHRVSQFWRSGAVITQPVNSSYFLGTTCKAPLAFGSFMRTSLAFFMSSA